MRTRARESDTRQEECKVYAGESDSKPELQKAGESELKLKLVRKSADKKEKEIVSKRK